MITGVNLRMPARRTALPALLLIATALLAVATRQPIPAISRGALADRAWKAR
ncbi:hypothetical protein [Streptomyces albidoflavus]|uniref:hypothetical protein n=1 Tax=Streptomyces albidoflavus TaxID=1886 RepID=UPI00211CB69B|nr:hypothetical protein [Streptomyces albidoflavus]